MNCSLVRSVVGTAIACGAFITGPMCVGVGVSNADLVGGVGGLGGDVDVLGVDVLGGKSSGGSSTLARANTVSTAPSARSVVIRSKPVVKQLKPSVEPAVSLAPVRTVPVEALGTPLPESASPAATA